MCGSNMGYLDGHLHSRVQTKIKSQERLENNSLKSAKSKVDKNLIMIQWTLWEQQADEPFEVATTK